MFSHRFHNDPAGLLRCRDSIYASDLLVCAIVHLDFFTLLKAGPLNFDEVCSRLHIAPRPADVMLSLFQAMQLIELRNSKYGLTPLAAEYLVSDSPVSLVPYYLSLKNRPQCQEFYAVLKGGKPAGWSSGEDGTGWMEAMRDESFATSFTAAMDSRGAYLAQKLAQVVDLTGHQSLLDVAGGSGIYACSLARRFGHLAAAVLEISPVDVATERSIRDKGMQGRVRVITGDMFKLIPEGYDAHLFANTFHDWDMESICKLIALSYAALPPGGVIQVFDAHLNAGKNGPLAVAEYACLLMHSTEGRCYSTSEITVLLQEAGFTGVAVENVAADRTVISGKKEGQQ